MERGPIKALNVEGSVKGNPSVYPVGPIIQTATSSIDANGLECLS
ncbi:UDP-glucuronosyltransferase 3A1, partial [Trifolium medium]|nr:UDP-glucuronosyltransferase 3A1 [Trifolium medium]